MKNKTKHTQNFTVGCKKKNGLVQECKNTLSLKRLIMKGHRWKLKTHNFARLRSVALVALAGFAQQMEFRRL